MLMMSNTEQTSFSERRSVEPASQEWLSDGLSKDCAEEGDWTTESYEPKRK
jgi:hypothetical protein